MKPTQQEQILLAALKKDTGKNHHLKKIKKDLPWSEENKRFGTTSENLYWFRGDWHKAFYLEEKLAIADIKNKLAWGWVLDDGGLSYSLDVLPIPVLVPDIETHIETCFTIAKALQTELQRKLQTLDINKIDSDIQVCRIKASIANLLYTTNKPEFLSNFITAVTGDIPNKKQLAILAEKTAYHIITLDPSRSAKNTRYD